MPMEKSRYPANWKALALEVKQAAGWRCQYCGRICRQPGEPFDTHRRTLTVHHLNHIPEDCRKENLVALCPACHLKADAEHHAETRRRKKGERWEVSAAGDPSGSNGRE